MSADRFELFIDKMLELRSLYKQNSPWVHDVSSLLHSSTPFILVRSLAKILYSTEIPRSSCYFATAKSWIAQRVQSLFSYRSSELF